MNGRGGGALYGFVLVAFTIFFVWLVAALVELHLMPDLVRQHVRTRP